MQEEILVSSSYVFFLENHFGTSVYCTTVNLEVLSTQHSNCNLSELYS